MRSIAILFLLGVSASRILGQQDSAPPRATTGKAVELKRAPPAQPRRKSVPSLLQQYDFGAQIEALQQADGLPTPGDVTPEFVSGITTSSASSTESRCRKTIGPKRISPLPRQLLKRCALASAGEARTTRPHQAVTAKSCIPLALDCRLWSVRRCACA
jgi:hypothetical protein